MCWMENIVKKEISNGKSCIGCCGREIGKGYKWLKSSRNTVKKCTRMIVDADYSRFGNCWRNRDLHDGGGKANTSDFLFWYTAPSHCPSTSPLFKKVFIHY